MDKRITLALLALAAVACTPKMTIVWNEADIPAEVLPVTPDGIYEKGADYDSLGIYELLVCNPPKGLDWELWGIFPARDRGPKISPTFTEEISWEKFDGKLYVMKPQVQKDTLRFLYWWGRLPSYSWAPNRFFLRLANGKEYPVDVKYNFVPEEPEPVREYVKKEVLPLDMIPQLKKVEYLEGETEYNGAPEILTVEGKKDGWYKITADGSLKVEVADYSGEVYARNTLERIAKDGKVPNVVIEDWPEVPLRVIMMNCSGMHYPVDYMKQTIDVMSRYRMNILHLHLTDDGGWRLAIDGLPELTEYGAFHKLPVKNENGEYEERDALCINMIDDQYANGFYTREQFIELVRYAATKAVTIVPEVDMPAHSKASVRAMEIRARRTGDTTYLLTDPADTSKTNSIQGYKRNTINVTMPSTYRFIEMVLDDIISMYQEAGTELKYFHIGGDEVPDGVWMGSPIAQKFMAETGLKTKGELRGYFIERMLDLLKAKGVKACGWSSMTYNVPDKVRWRVRDEVGYINCGQTLGNADLEKKLYELVNDGVPCCINCCGHAYMANAYSYSKYESGHYYAGYTDERRAFSLMPYALFDDNSYVKTHPESVVGVGTLLWNSYKKNLEEISECLYPKVLGIYERAWNAKPEGETASFDKFYSIVAEKEVPWMDANGIPHRVVLNPKEN